MTERSLVDIGDVRDLYGLLSAIAEVFSGSDSLLCLESVGFASEIEAFLQAHAVSDPPDIGRETIWPLSRLHCLSCKGGVVGQFARLAGSSFAKPEVCDHLSVVRSGRKLLVAPDAGFGHVLVDSYYADQLTRKLH